MEECRSGCPAVDGVFVPPQAGNGAAEMKRYFVYVLESLRDHGHYIGSTHNLKQRLADHNAGKTRSLRARRPLRLIHVEEFTRRSDAKAREKQIKSYKRGEAFRRLLCLASVRLHP